MSLFSDVKSHTGKLRWVRNDDAICRISTSVAYETDQHFWPPQRYAI